MHTHKHTQKMELEKYINSTIPYPESIKCRTTYLKHEIFQDDNFKIGILQQDSNRKM
jgi:hypothetical protein